MLQDLFIHVMPRLAVLTTTCQALVILYLGPCSATACIHSTTDTCLGLLSACCLPGGRCHARAGIHCGSQQAKGWKTIATLSPTSVRAMAYRTHSLGVQLEPSRLGMQRLVLNWVHR
jgi:hypothetical protein